MVRSFSTIQSVVVQVLSECCIKNLIEVPVNQDGCCWLVITMGPKVESRGSLILWSGYIKGIAHGSPDVARCYINEIDQKYQWIDPRLRSDRSIL